MNKLNYIFFVLVFILSLSYASADVISVNSGGNNELVINPETYIDGFFSKICVPYTCFSLGYNCNSWDDGCGKTLNCGTCSSGYTCSSGVCTGTTPGGDDGGAGGGGGGGGGSDGGLVASSLIVDPNSINLTLSFNDQTKMSQRATQKIYITNNGTTDLTLSVSQTGLDNVIFFENTPIIVSPGQTQTLPIDFVAPLEQKDIIGSIKITNSNTGAYKEIPVFLHITSNPLWFDSNIVVLNKDYKISQGSLLKTKVELVPMGEKSRLDVTLNYVIKDMNGKIYLTKSETILVEQRINFERNFDTGMLPLGKYVIYLDLIYPGGVAPSSAHFDIIKKSASDIFGIILFILVIGILFIAIFIIFLLIRKKKKKKEEVEETEEETA